MPKDKSELPQAAVPPRCKTRRCIHNMEQPTSDPLLQTDIKPPIPNFAQILKKGWRPPYRRVRFQAMPYKDTSFHAGRSWPKREMVPASRAEPASSSSAEQGTLQPLKHANQEKLNSIVQQMRLIVSATKTFGMMMATLQIPIEEKRERLLRQVASVIHAPWCGARNMFPAQLPKLLPVQNTVQESNCLIQDELYRLFRAPPSQCWRTGTNCAPLGCPLPVVKKTEDPNIQLLSSDLVNLKVS